MSKSFYVIITAAGRGVRMGGDTPKQFLTLDGKPILRRTIETFVEACPDAHVVVVLPKDHISEWRDYCVESNFTCPQTLVEGGITRFHSVRNSLAKVPDGVTVAIHDGVRPFVSEALITLMRERMETERALIPVMPSTDTLTVLEKGEDGCLHSGGGHVDRSRIFAVQTPQMFRSEELKAAYAQAYDPSFTDDGSVALKNGIPLSFIQGERYNIKITTPEDMPLAEFISGMRSR